jgi:hypothetical protein
MSEETKFKCDICNTEIKVDRFSHDTAFALKWAGDGMKRDVLVAQTCGSYRDAPLHFCLPRIDATVNLRKELK